MRVDGYWLIGTRKRKGVALAGGALCGGPLVAMLRSPTMDVTTSDDGDRRKTGSRKHRRAYAALVVGALGIGVAPLFVRWIHQDYHVGPTAIAFWRMVFALPVFAVVLGLRRGRSIPVNAADLDAVHVLDHAAVEAPAIQTAGTVDPSRAWVAAAGIFFAADLAMWHWSLIETSIANATLLGNLAPVFVAAGAAALFAQPCSRWFAIALAFTVLGGACLVASSADLGREHLQGDGLALGSAVMYAAYILTVSRLRRRFEAMAIMTWSGTVAMAVFLAIALIAGDSFRPTAGGGWLALLAFALVSQVLGQGLVVYALDVVSAPFTSVMLLIQPVLATLLAWPLFGEPIGSLQAVGAVVVLAAIVLAKRSSP